jgi:hypothetical protein
VIVSKKQIATRRIVPRTSMEAVLGVNNDEKPMSTPLSGITYKYGIT